MKLKRKSGIKSKTKIAVMLAAAVTPLVGLTSTSGAAQIYWDISSNNGLQAGSGNWSASTSDKFWSTSSGGTALSAWVNGDSAAFQTASNNTVTVNGTIVVLGIVQNSTSGTVTTINNGTTGVIQLGSTQGGPLTSINNTNTNALTFGSGLVLSVVGSQTWQTTGFCPADS